jgi:hypothetical protein
MEEAVSEQDFYSGFGTSGFRIDDCGTHFTTKAQTTETTEKT